MTLLPFTPAVEPRGHTLDRKHRAIRSVALRWDFSARFRTDDLEVGVPGCQRNRRHGTGHARDALLLRPRKSHLRLRARADRRKQPRGDDQLPRQQCNEYDAADWAA